MKIRKSQLRQVIRHVLREQVVGYIPPKKNGSGNGGYLSMGDMGVDVSLDDESTDEQQASAEQVKTLTQQRQQDLDKGDTVDAESEGEQLGMARRMRG